MGADLEMLGIRGSIATYATEIATPSIPFWPLLFNSKPPDQPNRHLSASRVMSCSSSRRVRTQAANAIDIDPR